MLALFQLFVKDHCIPELIREPSLQVFEGPSLALSDLGQDLAENFLYSQRRRSGEANPGLAYRSTQAGPTLWLD